MSVSHVFGCINPGCCNYPVDLNVTCWITIFLPYRTLFCKDKLFCWWWCKSFIQSLSRKTFDFQELRKSLSFHHNILFLLLYFWFFSLPSWTWCQLTFDLTEIGRWCRPYWGQTMALTWKERRPMKQVCELSASLGQASSCPFGLTFHILSGSVLRTWTMSLERILSLNPQSQVAQMHLLGKVAFLHFDYITIFIFQLIKKKF